MQPLSAAIPPASIFSGLPPQAGALSPPFPAARAGRPGGKGSGRVLGSGAPAGEAQSPLRREGQDPAALRHLRFGSPFAGDTGVFAWRACAWKHKLEELAALLSRYHQGFFKTLGLSGSSAEGARWAHSSVCSHVPPGVPRLLRGPGLMLVPLLDVFPPRPPLSRSMRRSGGCVKWRDCLRGAVCRHRLLPPEAPVLASKKNSPKCNIHSVSVCPFRPE
ncbi:uncharacterized protein LOC135301020 [Passer domesticus]|uniref:uncharacterized protein LOC135301020 n=1 Tax=Passer domesticus TaxID=48849 RepID=UPI0030FE19A6